jgi:hypothetical protein
MNMAGGFAFRRLVLASAGVFAVAAMATTGSSAATAAMAATAAAARPASAPAASWQIASSIRGQYGTALAPVSRSSAWVFADPGCCGNVVPTAWRVDGTATKQYPFPAKAGEVIDDAAASSADNVWAVSSHRVFAWNGAAWRVMRTYRASTYLDSVLPLGPTNVLVFASNGTWHFGPSGWARERTGDGLYRGSELSSDSVWAVEPGAQPDVAHWNGATWSRTSLASLLPKSPYLCQYGLSGVLAESARNIWVTASGNCQDAGGPLALQRAPLGAGAADRRLRNRRLRRGGRPRPLD